MNLTLISHFYNEEVLMPSWLEHHLPLFDRLILVDHQSTDSSRDVIKSLAPDAIVIPSRLTEFDAWQNDLEIMEVEKTYYKGPQITCVLNTTEFICAIDFAQTMNAHVINDHLADAWGVGSIILVDKEGVPSGTWGFKDPGHIRRKRYFHCSDNGQYHLGRHGTNLPAQDVDDVHILYKAFSPWPDIRARKLQVQTRIPIANKQSGLGFEHLVTSEQLDQKYQEYLAMSGDLTLLTEFSC